MLHKEKFLLIPGPTEVPPEVLAVMGRPILAHYMDEWLELYNETISMLKKLFRTKNDVLIITGSCSAALEAAICGIIEPGDKVIADEIFRVAVKAHGGKLIDVSVPTGNYNTPERIEEALKREGDVKAVALLHNISWGGVTNPIDEIGEIVNKYGTIFIVDAVSSLGAIDLKPDEWHIDIPCSGSQKALSVPPGISFLSVSQKAWEIMENRKEPIQSWYLNLLDYRRPPIDPQKIWHPTPTTPSTVLIRALWQSLKMILEEGLEHVFKRHAVAAKAVREGIKAMGLELLVKEERYASNTVTAVVWPEGYDYKKLWYTLYNDYNIMIGNPPIQQPIPGKTIFRIGHMGSTAQPSVVLMALSYVERALKRVGYETKAAAGVAAAQEIFQGFLE